MVLNEPRPRLRLVIPGETTFVIPSNARDLGFCLHQHYCVSRQKPSSLASLGMTTVEEERKGLGYLRREAEHLRLIPLPRQVVPLRIYRFNQRDSLHPRPRLDLFLPLDRIADILESLKYTSLEMLYFAANPGLSFSLCSRTRRRMLLVIPV